MGLLAGLLLGSYLSLVHFHADFGTGFQLVAGDTPPWAPEHVWSEDAADVVDDDKTGKCNAFSLGFQAELVGGCADTAGLIVRAQALFGAPRGARCSLFLACGRLTC
jgi:hypothetical protein